MKTVRDLMTHVNTVPPFRWATDEGTSALELSGQMLDREVHEVVVLRGNRIVGTISSRQLIRGLQAELIQIIAQHCGET